MSAPTPVTTSVITAESASSRSPNSTWKEPAAIHGHSEHWSDAPGGRGGDDETDVAEHEDQPDDARAEVQTSHEVHEQHRPEHRAEIVGGGRAARDRAQRGMSNDVAEPLTDIGAHRGPLGGRSDGRFGSADEQHAEGGKQQD